MTTLIAEDLLLLLLDDDSGKLTGPTLTPGSVAPCSSSWLWVAGSRWSRAPGYGRARRY